MSDDGTREPQPGTIRVGGTVMRWDDLIETFTATGSVHIPIAPRCSTCLHWRPNDPGYRGECRAFTYADANPQAVAFGDLFTEATFGCVEHSPRPATPDPEDPR